VAEPNDIHVSFLCFINESLACVAALGSLRQEFI
jgi:hypothetical protein